MTILDKHPAPWRGFPQHAPPLWIVDANGVEIATVGDVEHRREDVERLILAAPELLAALKAMLVNEMLAAGTSEPVSVDGAAAAALIERIEGTAAPYRCAHNPGDCICDGPGTPARVNGRRVVCSCQCHIERIEEGGARIANRRRWRFFNELAGLYTETLEGPCPKP